MNKIPAIGARLDMINGAFELGKETTDFMELCRKELADTAARIASAAPANCDVGRLIAAIDAIQAAKNILCDSAILGSEIESRKKRKASDISDDALNPGTQSQKPEKAVEQEEKTEETEAQEQSESKVEED